MDSDLSRTGRNGEKILLSAWNSAGFPTYSTHFIFWCVKVMKTGADFLKEFIMVEQLKSRNSMMPISN